MRFFQKPFSGKFIFYYIYLYERWHHLEAELLAVRAEEGAALLNWQKRFESIIFPVLKSNCYTEIELCAGATQQKGQEEELCLHVVFFRSEPRRVTEL